MLKVALEEMQAPVESLDFQPLFVTVSGAHLYGFPSADSDVDLRGCHLLPLQDMLGLTVPSLTLHRTICYQGTTVDFVSHEALKFLRLLDRNDGNILEQIFSPLVVVGRKFLEELQPVARRCINRLFYHHYRGFYASQRKLIAKEQPKRAKSVLYAYRVLLTGIHLLRTGQVEANLLPLKEHFHLGFLDELIAQKVQAEKTPAEDLDWSFHEARLAELELQLDEAFAQSPLPDHGDRKALNEFLLQLRLGN